MHPVFGLVSASMVAVREESLGSSVSEDVFTERMADELVTEPCGFVTRTENDLPASAKVIFEMVREEVVADGMSEPLSIH